ncbi:hydroxyacylglutathione hydrolase [Buchnera aphidicola (Formosaphis micheliae)]|uniref:hydroxyacylglutathione hydrolase n=1 Tax=Buchnera aphidicola TaxID=9 RepID=UPI0031CCB673
MYLNLSYINAINDNYIWILNNEKGFIIIIDPGDSASVIKTIKIKNYKPKYILLTHYHKDHTAGVESILNNYPNIKVYGPKIKNNKTYIINIEQKDQYIYIMQYKFLVIMTPGHTENCISYYLSPYLFCGDTLFSGGCGRVFTKDYNLMLNSLKKISKFPNDTLICCGHDNTVNNLMFSKSVFPKDSTILFYEKKIKKLIKKSKSTLPSKLQDEKKHNLFLRTTEVNLQKKLLFKNNDLTKINEINFFYQLRRMKDRFCWS